MPGIAHTPVMLEEVLSFLVPSRGDELMLDCTLGEGGHAEAFLARYPGISYVGIDADPAIQAKARERLSPFAGRAAFLLGYFDEVLANWNDLALSFGENSGEKLVSEAQGSDSSSSRSVLQRSNRIDEAIVRPSLILFDLGISMFHFAESGRGFGHGKDEELDMRLSPEAPRSAATLLAEEREEEIARIIFEYGEERLSRRIAKAIVEARRKGGIKTTGALAELVWNAVPAEYRHGRLHPATRTFQALRIAVNDELGRAERGLRRAAALLAPGGLVAVISFHSLEDRIAKNVLRELSGRGRPAAEPRRPVKAYSTPPSNPPIHEGEDGGAPLLELVTKKPVEPSPEEVARNPASRSAKLRVARKAGERAPGRTAA
jgi:16S rRNA (cytosine1402-N4)-methyltransferase